MGQIFRVCKCEVNIHGRTPLLCSIMNVYVHTVCSPDGIMNIACEHLIKQIH